MMLPKEWVNKYFSELVENKNFWLIHELKESTKFDYGQPPRFFDENKILASLLRELNVSKVNEVWRPFGEAAISEIEEERTKGYESNLFLEYREGKYLWEYKTYCSLQFFKILVNEALVKKYTKSHFCLHYYWYITRAILKTFEKYPSKITSIYHQFIKIMIDNLFLWLEISNKKEDKSLYNPILNCMGNIIHELCVNNVNKLYGSEKIISILDTLLKKYCSLQHNAQTNKLRRKIEEKLLNPSRLTGDNSPYYKYFAETWKQFDKIPHRMQGGMGDDLDYFKQLKQKVIKPLGLDPNIQ